MPLVAPMTKARSLVLLLALVLATTALTMADGNSAPATASPTGSAAEQGPVSTAEVTLVTGDEVRVTTSADGRETAVATPAPRPDGSTPAFWTHERDGDLYVVPLDMAGLLPDRLDPMLFNVSALVENGYVDAKQDGLPLIVTYRPSARPKTQAAPFAGGVRELESVHGIAVRADHDGVTRLGAQLSALAAGPDARTLASGPLAGFDKIWLDRKTEVELDESTAQIGAPTAWEQGYDGSSTTIAVLDTGVDSGHPDLAGAVGAEQNFTFGEDATDGHGHGTHVASIAAGDGSASDGARSGVAPGASLVSGKVLDDQGFGLASWLIDGMEWAAQEQEADVVNMSLGFAPGSYGAGPVTDAVESLTEETGALFVVAAGNDGCDACIGAPGDAPSAMTVGAVDDDDQLADFSSRGPAPDTGALKPDITAPGVGVVAARAAGTSLGEPVDDLYTPLSGTSMAAPHVAGAAAIVAQAKPGLAAAQVKALLMNTAAAADDVSAYGQGAGRVDLEAAVDGTVLATPGWVDFGFFRYPHDQRDPAVRDVTYTNLGDAPVTLDLSVSAPSQGVPSPAGALALSTETLEVPANGTATVQLSLDTSVPDEGRYEGVLTAQADSGDEVRTVIGYELEEESYNVRVEGIARDGRPAFGGFGVHDVVDGSFSATRFWREESDASCTGDAWGLSTCLRLPAGTYSVSGLVFTMPQWAPSRRAPGALGSYRNTSLVAEPEVTVDSDTTLTLDARNAEEVQIDTPDHDTKRNLGAARQLMFHRAADDGQTVNDGVLLNPGDQLEERLFMQPTEPVSHGDIAAYTQWQLEAPAITFDVTAAEEVELAPLYYDKTWFSDNSWQFPRLDGEHQLRLVDAGTATTEELAGRDLHDALALVRRSDALSVAEQSNNAAAAGATMVAVYNDVPGSNARPGGTGVKLEVPTVRLSHAEGASLLDLLGPDEVTVNAHGETASPYRYNLVLAEEGHIPQDLRYVAHADELAAVQNDFHSQLSDDLTLSEAWFALQPWEDFAMSVALPTLGGPRSRTDFYVAGHGTEYAQSVITPESSYNHLWPQPPTAEVRLQSERNSYEAGQQVTEEWLQGPLRPGLWPLTPIARSGDVMRVRMAAFVDSDEHFSEGYTSMFDHGFSTHFRMYADDKLIEETPWLANGTIAVPADAEGFRIEYDVDNEAPWAKLSTATSSVWTFGSSPPADGEVRVEPLLTVDYDVDLDLHNRAPAPEDSRGPHQVAFTVQSQRGAPDLPIESASLSVSFDDGDSWREVRHLRDEGGGRYVATLPRTAAKDSDGFLSLRIHAEDAEGNGVEQEVIRAYALPAR